MERTKEQEIFNGINSLLADMQTVKHYHDHVKKMSENYENINTSVSVIKEKVTNIESIQKEEKQERILLGKKVSEIEGKYNKAMGGLGVVLALGVGWVLNLFKQLLHP